MTPDTDRIEELARYHANKIVKRMVTLSGEELVWHEEQAAFLRSLSAELAELRQAKESLDWCIDNGYCPWGSDIDGQRGMPPYLKSRLEGKK